MSDEPVDGITPIAGAGNACVLSVNVWELYDGIKYRIQIRHDLSAPILRDFVDKPLAETSRTSWIGGGNHPSLRRPQGRIPAIGPPILPRTLRAAVNQEHCRVFL